MQLEPLDPWKELEEFRAESQRLLDTLNRRFHGLFAGGKAPAFVPEADVVEMKDEFRIYVSIPGMIEEDLDLSLESGVLIIRGERQSPYDPQRGRSHLTEWRYGEFERRIPLDPGADFSRLQASYAAGVLVILLPKSRPREAADPDSSSA